MLLRCSSLGMLMGKSKGSQPYGLSATAQGVVKDIADAYCYNTPITVDNKYMTKGRDCEDDSIELFNDVFFMDLVKNEVRLSNEHITGECDLLSDDLVIDIKSSWSVKQFAEMRRKATDYEWQLRGYMLLYEKSKACTAHCLVDTPDKLCRFDGAVHKFAHIPKSDRVIIGNQIEREDKYEDMIKEKHEACLAYYNDLLDDFKKGRELP